jgi:hypothetical protein
LLISSALTVFVLIVGVGVAWHLQAADNPAGTVNAADLAVADTATTVPSDPSMQDGGRPAESAPARGDHTASSARPVLRQGGSGAVGEEHAPARERERPARWQSGRATGGQEGSLTQARTERPGSWGERDD